VSFLSFLVLVGPFWGLLGGVFVVFWLPFCYFMHISAVPKISSPYTLEQHHFLNVLFPQYFYESGYCPDNKSVATTVGCSSRFAK
jgi:hypothetical protein